MSIASGRLSYVLGLHGPCVSYDTACSAALAANHSALRAIQHHECTSGLVTGISLMLLPQVGVTFATAGMTSATGSSKTFDIRADGYARGEACGAVVLQCEQDLEEGGVQVLGSCLRQDGKSASLTAPNGQAQQGLYRAAISDANVSEGDLSCVEAHGTGTPLGDPIEAGSLAAAVVRARSGQVPLVLGSVKANAGHAEPAAGVTGMLRLAAGLLAMQGSPNAQLRIINPHVLSALDGWQCCVPTQQAKLGAQALEEVRRLGNVSSFGYSGTIAHAVLGAHSRSLAEANIHGKLIYQRRAFKLPQLYEAKSIPRRDSALNSVATSEPSSTQAGTEEMYRYDYFSPLVVDVYAFEWAEAESGGVMAADDEDIQVRVSADVLLIGHAMYFSGFLNGLPWQCHCSANIRWELGPWHAIVFAASQRDESELPAVSSLHDLLRALLSLASSVPIWVFTSLVSSGRRERPIRCVHSGLCGFTRATQQELPSAPLWLLDVGDIPISPEEGWALSTLLKRCHVTLACGHVRGLNFHSSREPEARLLGSSLSVPRLVAARLADDITLGLGPLAQRLDECVRIKNEEVDIEGLIADSVAIEQLCEEYIHDAVEEIDGASVIKWHHKLLFRWFCSQEQRDGRHPNAYEIGGEVEAWPELRLAKHCGPSLRDVLVGRVSYQDVLFPNGSLALVLPVYEASVAATYYHECVVAAVQAIKAQMAPAQMLSVVEIGAGTGGITSRILPAVETVCVKYAFTDVLDIFLVEAKEIFARYAHLMWYGLLNIDVDPRLQGYALYSYDVAIAANVLYATPFIRTTVRHCRQLLQANGALLVNEVLRTTAFTQMTFGLADGWWLFQVDPERQNNSSPLLSLENWRVLFCDSGFPTTYAMQGPGPLIHQATMVALCSRTPRKLPNPHHASNMWCRGTHLFAGGITSLGRMTGEFLIERGATSFILAAHFVQGAGTARLIQSLREHGSGVSVRLFNCDASNDADVRALIMAAGANVTQLAGILQLSPYIVSSSAVVQQSAGAFQAAYGSKVHAVRALHTANIGSPLRYFSAYTSAVGRAGPFFQSPATTCGAWLDALAAYRHSAGLPGRCVQWGGFTGLVGVIGGRPSSELSPFWESLPSQGAGAVHHDVIYCSLITALSLVAPSQLVVLPEAWIEVLDVQQQHASWALPWRGQLWGHLAFPDALLKHGERAERELHGVEASTRVATLAAQILGDLDPDIPLEEYGLDSAVALEFGTRLRYEFDELPENALYEYPTLRALGECVVQRQPMHQVAAEAGRKSPPRAEDTQAVADVSAKMQEDGELASDEVQPVCLGVAVWRLRAAPEEWDAFAIPRLVIMHGMFGDEREHEQLYQRAYGDREILSIRHPGLHDVVIDEGHLTDMRKMVHFYAAELIALIGDDPFDMVGASMGASLAHACAVACRRLGGAPRRLVLIDPPLPESLDGLMLRMSSSFRISFRQAAEFLLLTSLDPKSGDRTGDEENDGEADAEGAAIRLYLKSRTTPEELLPYLLAKVGTSGIGQIQAGSADVEAALVRATQRIKSLQHCLNLFLGTWTSRREFNEKFTSPSEAPCIFLVQASVRDEFSSLVMLLGLQGSRSDAVKISRGLDVNVGAVKACIERCSSVDTAVAMFRLAGFGEIIREAMALLGPSVLFSFNSYQAKGIDGVYGPSALAVRMEGTHFAITMRCLSRGDSDFKYLLDMFLGRDSISNRMQSAAGEAMHTAPMRMAPARTAQMTLSSTRIGSPPDARQERLSNAPAGGMGAWHETVIERVMRQRKAWMTELKRRLKLCLHGHGPS